MDFLDTLVNLILFPRSTASLLAAILAFFAANRFLDEGVSLLIGLMVGILVLCAFLMLWPLRDKSAADRSGTG
jgi:hypothetical protein